MFCLAQYIANHHAFLLKQVFLIIVFYYAAALHIMIAFFCVVLLQNSHWNLLCTYTCQTSYLRIFLFLLFSSSAPCTPPKRTAQLSFPSSVVWRQRTENQGETEVAKIQTNFKYLWVRKPSNISTRKLQRQLQGWFLALGIDILLPYPTGFFLSWEKVLHWLNMH